MIQFDYIYIYISIYVHHIFQMGLGWNHMFAKDQTLIATVTLSTPKGVSNSKGHFQNMRKIQVGEL